MSTRTALFLAAAALTSATPALAQQGGPAAPTDSTTPTAKAPEKGAAALLAPAIDIQHLRPNDQRGINVFEAPKADKVPFTGFRLNFGAAFTQQFQGLGHENSAAAKVAQGSTVNQNQLIQMGHGFNNAVANAYVNGQLAKGIRVAMTAYLSARHHQETWVKDGYLQIDDSPLDVPILNTLMQYVTVKAGHFEINYGDAHFRRTDNGNAMYNPLVGNYIMDAFTTSIGGEVLARGRGRLDGLFVMGGITNGEVRGTILNAGKRAPAFLGKVGVDKQLTQDLRVRLTGSALSQSRSANQTLYSGDRGGSRYYDVLENTTSTEKDQAWSGSIQPGIAEMHAYVVNPFVKYRGLELFGNFERARGRSLAEQTAAAAPRAFSQNVVEGTYRFFGDKLFGSARYNTVTGRLAGFTQDVTVARSQVGGGWFITPLVMTKVEWVNQKYTDFPSTDIRNGGRFRGFMVEGVVAF